MNSRK